MADEQDVTWTKMQAREGEVAAYAGLPEGADVAELDQSSSSEATGQHVNGVNGMEGMEGVDGADGGGGTEGVEAATASGRAAGILPSLKRRVFSGSAWSMGGMAAHQVLGLVSTLVLTRLLPREAFGLMAIVTIFTLAADMFTDFGLRDCIVQHERGEDADFYNTAWTIQAVRGFGIWIVVCLVAFPVAWVYQEPYILLLLPAVGFAACINGFQSTARFALIRRLQLRPNVMLEVGCSIVALVVTVGWALIWHSVWALVGGTLVRDLVKTVWTYYLIPGYRNWFRFDRRAARAIYLFARWVLVSTFLSFVLAQGDRLVLGKVMPLALLGVYSMAFLIVNRAEGMMKKLSSEVLFPVYSELASRGRAELRRNAFRLRGALMLLFLPPTCLVAIFSREIVAIMFPADYWPAGWMLQILAIGLIGRFVMISTDKVLVAHGNTFHQMILQIGRGILLVAGMGLGLWGWGVPGLLIGMTLAKFAEYPLLAVLIRPYGVWLPGLDAAALFGSSGVVVLGIWLHGGLLF